MWTLGVFLVIWTVIAVVFYDPGYKFINWYTTVMWTLPFGVAVIGIFGSFIARRIIKKHPTPDQVNVCDSPLDVVITTIGSEGVLGALTRVIRSTAAFGHYFNNYTIFVVTEQTSKALVAIRALVAMMPKMELVVVPTGYSTTKGTRFKARAAQYALEQRVLAFGGVIRNMPFDHWTFHIDDDTAVGEDTARAIAVFIAENQEPGSKHLAQGVLTYRYQDCQNPYMRLADSIRSFDDISRFPATTATGHPVAGLHGENMLVRSCIEANIGWDFGPDETVEDSRFALVFNNRYPGMSAWHPGRVYGAAPISAADFVKQRGRWAEGMLRLALNRTLPLRRRLLILHNMLVWILGIFQPAVVVLAASALVGDYNVSPIAAWVAPLWVISVSYTYWAYWEGLRQNAYASGDKAPRIWERIIILPCIFWFSVLEGAAGTWGAVRIITKRETTFYNVAKPV